MFACDSLFAWKSAMFRKMLRCKIHRATVTHCDPDYVGSITIDANLLEAAGSSLDLTAEGPEVPLPAMMPQLDHRQLL